MRLNHSLYNITAIIKCGLECKKEIRHRPRAAPPVRHLSPPQVSIRKVFNEKYDQVNINLISVSAWSLYLRLNNSTKRLQRSSILVFGSSISCFLASEVAKNTKWKCFSEKTKYQIQKFVINIKHHTHLLCNCGSIGNINCKINLHWCRV